jgi:O-antigen ligase
VNWRLDTFGFLILVALTGWVLLAAGVSGGSAGPSVALIVATAGAYLIARALAREWRLLGAAAVLAVAVGLTALSPGEVLSSAPLSGPFGYVNAKAAFFVQSAIAGLILALGSGGSGGRVAGAVGAVGSAVVVLANGSLAAVVLLVSLPLLALLLTNLKSGRVAIATSAVLFLVALVGTILLAASYLREGEAPRAAGFAERLLSDRRLTLWTEALTLLAEHPTVGVGPDRFQVESPTARRDQDARWAHNEFLQQGAETGVVGLALLVLLFLWGFARLGTGAPDSVAVLGAVSLAALGIHACLDYVLHFPGVPIATAVLVGAASSRPKGTPS